eukprot:SAG22_NODE_271_length_13227_cov_34.282983_4_plen_452_part_00
MLPHSYTASVVDAIAAFKEADSKICGALDRRQLLQLTRELGWDDADCWRTSQLMGDARGAVSLQAFIALYNDRQLVSELMRVYDRDRNGALSAVEFKAMGLGWGGMSPTVSELLLAGYDRDGDGELSEAELLELISSGRKLQKAQPGALAAATSSSESIEVAASGGPAALDVNGLPAEGGPLWQYLVRPEEAAYLAEEALAAVESEAAAAAAAAGAGPPRYSQDFDNSEDDEEFELRDSTELDRDSTGGDSPALRPTAASMLPASPGVDLVLDGVDDGGGLSAGGHPPMISDDLGAHGDGLSLDDWLKAATEILSPSSPAASGGVTGHGGLPGSAGSGGSEGTPGADPMRLSDMALSPAANADAANGGVGGGKASMSDAEVQAAMQAAMIASQGNLSNAAVRAKTMGMSREIVVTEAGRRSRSNSDPRSAGTDGNNSPAPRSMSRSSDEGS